MAKRTNKTSSNSAASARTQTTVRNTAVPPKSAVPKIITHEMICQRAYEISQSGQGGSEVENWLRAERELRG